MPLIYLIAGEPSGDILGGRLIEAVRARRPEIRFAGVGGAMMAASGVPSLFPIEELSVMGFVEIVPRLRGLRRRLRETVADIAVRRPDVLVTIDSPGFTLRILRAIASLGIKRIHYVAPQVWAWREGRVRDYPGLWDRLLCLLPFEPEFFARHDLPASFVGHPVLESGAGSGDGARFRVAHRLSPHAGVLTVMPGSRAAEVRRLMPILGETMRRLPSLVPAVPIAGPVASAVRQGTETWPVPPILITDQAEKHDAFAASSVALTKSGTSTLELALADLPMLVAYRVNRVSSPILRRMMKVRYAALVNLLAGGIGPEPGPPLVPELIQQDCTPDNLARTITSLLGNQASAAAQRTGFRAVLDSLRPPGGLLPSEAAADAVIEVLEEA